MTIPEHVDLGIKIALVGHKQAKVMDAMLELIKYLNLDYETEVKYGTPQLSDLTMTSCGELLAEIKEQRNAIELLMNTFTKIEP